MVIKVPEDTIIAITRGDVRDLAREIKEISTEMRKVNRKQDERMATHEQSAQKILGEINARLAVMENQLKWTRILAMILSIIAMSVLGAMFKLLGS